MTGEGALRAFLFGYGQLGVAAGVSVQRRLPRGEGVEEREPRLARHQFVVPLQPELERDRDTYDLQRRLAAAGARTGSLAAHPGKARTDLTRYLSRWMQFTDLMIEQPFGHNAAMGALATLRAATDPAARAGEYYGPSSRGELRGYPRLVTSTERARDVDAQQRLWHESERLTGVTYPV